MTAVDDGGPAFSTPTVMDPGSESGYADERIYEGGRAGMSLRDYFAGQVLAGTWVGRQSDLQWEDTRECVAKACYELADALIAEKRRTES